MLINVETRQKIKRHLKLSFISSTPIPKNMPMLTKKEIGYSKNIWKKEFHLYKKLDNVKFIHAGKCGGTSIMHSFLNSGIEIEEYHLKKPAINDDYWYFIWLRDPVKRFVSAFIHSKSILEFDYSSLNPNELSLENCPAPQKIYSRITNGYAFDQDYELLINEFSSANELAESLTSSDSMKKNMAIKLMNHPVEHIFKGIGWHLDNGKWVEKHKNQILMVGSIENMQNDFKRLIDVLKIRDENLLISNHRQGSNNFSKELSPLATDNIKKFYKKSDYKAISTLHKYNLISDDVFNMYIYSL